MPASDPTLDVPTPTGTLQGVAAFSWDGANWQPSGRAGPSVATPTGVLQGIAPFAWDGASWQPSGRAQPGVATPSGVLDGVAVYTWSGSAWVPASGTATPSTPSGALRGVAAFSWDGAVWQPAAQARPSVATPYGVLAGVAMFNWSGTTWAAGAAVPSGATLDLSFLTPGTLDPRITFTRASGGTYFNSAGVMQNAAVNQLLQSGDLSSVQWSSYQASVVGNSVVSPDGLSDAAQITASGTPGGRYNSATNALTVTVGTAQTVSCFFKWLSGPTTLILAVSGQNAFGDSSGDRDLQFNGQTGAFISKAVEISSYSIVPVGNGWFRASGTFTPGQTRAGDAAVAAYATTGTVFSAWGFQTEIGTPASPYIPTTSTPMGAPRWDYNPATLALNGLLIEEARTNLLLNSATLGTQGVAVTAQAYTLSFYGTGTITMSGAATGALVGTGPQRVSQTFTPAAGTLTCTVTGSVLNAQLEAGSFNTSWIPTTAAAATRALDVATMPAAGWFASPGGSWAAEFISFNPLAAASFRRILTIDVAASVGMITLDNTASLLGQWDGSAALFTANAVTVGAVAKGATTWTVGTAKACLNGGAVASSASLASGYAGVATNNLRLLSNATPAEGMSGYIRRVRYWPRVLSNAELQQVTT